MDEYELRKAGPVFVNGRRFRHAQHFGIPRRHLTRFACPYSKNKRKLLATEIKFHKFSVYSSLERRPYTAYSGSKWDRTRSAKTGHMAHQGPTKCVFNTIHPPKCCFAFRPCEQHSNATTREHESTIIHLHNGKCGVYILLGTQWQHRCD